MDSTREFTRFLDELPAELRRARVILERQDLLPQMERWGDAWRGLCAELDLSCPAELAALGDAMADVYVYIRVAAHNYAMLTPTDALEQREFLAKASATFWPGIGTLVPMLPLFGEDGDLLLLARDGRIHQLLHDDPSPDCVVADSLSHLVQLARPGIVHPG